MDKKPNNPNNPNNNQRPPRPPSAKQGPGRSGNRSGPGRSMTTSTGRSVSRGAAIRAQKQSVNDANKVANQYLDAASKQTDRPQRANVIDAIPRLRVIC